MSVIFFLVRKFCNVEIMPMVVVGRWQHKGGPHEPHPIFIFQTIFISNLITMIKRELKEPVAKFNIIPGIKGYCGHITHLRHILKLWYFDILFVYLFSCLLVPRVVLILQEKNGPIFLKKNYFLYFCKTNHFHLSKAGVPKNIFDA